MNTNTADAFSIRESQKEDAPLILKLIKELAEYEKLSHEVVATEEDLERSLFGEKAHAEVFIAEEEGEAIGFALFFHNYSTFLGKPGIYLEDLYIKESYRGKGYGKKMLKHLAKTAVDRGCGRFEWWVLDWNTPSIEFYKKMGAKAMDEWTVFRVDGKDLEELSK